MSIVFIISSAIITLLLLFFKKQNSNYNFTFACLPYSMKFVGILIIIGSAIVSSLHDINTLLVDSKNLAIILGLIIISLAKEKSETERLNSFRLYSLSISLFVTFVVYQIFFLFDLFKIRESPVAFLPICVLTTYLFVYYLGKRKLNNK